MSGKAELMFEVLSDGVVFFDPTGEPRFANRVARDLFGARVSTLFTELPTQKALAAIRNGTAQFPVSVRIEFARDGSLAPVDATILDWKSGGGYVFVLRRVQDTDPIRGDLSIVFELIEADLKNSIGEFLRLAQQVVAINPHLRTAGDDLLDKLANIVAHAEIFGSDEIVGNERVSLRAIFDECWPELAPLAAQRHIKVAVQGLTTNLPPVYGSHKWLKRALAEIIHNAIKHAIPGQSPEQTSLIDIEASGDGQWITLRVANGGLGILREIGGRVFMPFSRARVTGRVPMSGLGVGLPLARRIFELHGGKIKLDTTALGDRVDVTVTLPTGEARQNAQQLGIAQAQRYAEDMAKLLARRARRESANS